MKLFYREYGQGKPMIIIHGMLGMSDNWIPIARIFSDKYHVYLPDMRNHGFSPHNAKHDFQVMSKDVLEFFNDKGIDKAILIGHSMGGKVAVQFATDHFERIEKLIIIDISLRAYDLKMPDNKKIIDHKELLSFMSELNVTKIVSRQVLRERIKNKFDNEIILQLIQKNIKKDPVTGYKWKLNYQSLSDNLSKMSAEIKIDQSNFNFQSLFLFGSKSPYFLQDDYILIKETIANSKVDIIEDAGHAIHIEKKDELADKIKEFLML